MVQSTAATVDEYMTTLEPGRVVAMTRVRDLGREVFNGWAETMAYGMPGFGPAGGPPVFSYNSQVQYISLYAGKGAVEAFRDRLKGASLGGGCIRYRNPDKIDFDLVADILKHIRTHKGPGC